jgi:hypothetical protein
LLSILASPEKEVNRLDIAGVFVEIRIPVSFFSGGTQFVQNWRS